MRPVASVGAKNTSVTELTLWLVANACLRVLTNRRPRIQRSRHTRDAPVKRFHQVDAADQIVIVHLHHDIFSFTDLRQIATVTARRFDTLTTADPAPAAR